MATQQSDGVAHRSGASCCGPCSHGESVVPVTRRALLGGLGGATMLGGAALFGAAPEPPPAPVAESESPGPGLPPGRPLRLKPALVYQLAVRREKTSWRMYGGTITPEGIAQEKQRIEQELVRLAEKAEFPIEPQPLAEVTSPETAAAAAASDCDAIVVYAHSGQLPWLESLLSAGKPAVVFVRHRSGPFYFWYETALWHLLHKYGDEPRDPNIDADDIVVDDYGEMLWRLRALYALKNARGTKSVAIGGLAAYSALAEAAGPRYVKDVWGYEIHVVEMAEIEKRMAAARADAAVVGRARSQAERFVRQPGVTLQTEMRFIVNTFVALQVCRDLLAETGAANLGVAHCMGTLIAILDTTPCLLLGILNDEGITAFCHTDYSHTPAGVLMRWLAGKPPFLCNTHLPHDGQITLAHCAAPRRMNGRTCEPTTILTHFESDYGAASKIEYTKGQVTTNIVPNLRCTLWQGFRGRILESPAFDICRSQMEVRIEGDWARMRHEMQGFHAVAVYGDYLREVGYALKKVKTAWQNFSASAQ